MISATAATTASSIPIARTDTTPPTPLEQTAPINIPSLYNVGVETPRFFQNTAPASPRSQLRALAGAGDGTAIKRLLAHSKPDLNTPDPATGLTALMLAASQGHDDVVFLLAKGMEAQAIHCQTMQGDSALTLAAAAGHADVVALLLSKGAQQSHKDGSLASAAEAGQVAMIRLLVAHGANVHQADDQGNTALHHATAQGHLLAIVALMEANADIDQVNPRGDSALIIAARHGYNDVVDYLLDKGAQVGLRNYDNQDALGIALMADNLPVAKRLYLAAAWDPSSSQAPASSTPSATLTKHETAEPALVDAAGAGNLAHVEALLTKGADIDAADEMGWTALHNAAWRGHDAVVKRLLLSGADMNRADRNGATALMLASSAGELASVQALIDAGADLARRDAMGKTAADKATEMDHRLLATALSSCQRIASVGSPAAVGLAAVPPTTTASSSTSSTGTSSSTAMLPSAFIARKSDDIQASSAKPMTLMDAVQSNDVVAVTRLLNELKQSGKSVKREVNGFSMAMQRVTNKVFNGKVRSVFSGYTTATPLWAAACCGNEETIALLLNAGAKVNKAMPSCTSPLMVAAKLGHTGGVLALLRAGANVDQKSITGWTALMSAAYNGSLANVRTLLEAGARVD